MNSLKLVTPSSIRALHRLEAELVDAADDLVEAVVDRAVALGLRVPGGQPVLDPLAVALHREVDDRRRAAPGRRARTRLEGVRGRRAAERQLHVGVRVDAAGDDVLAARVHHLVDIALEVGAQQRPCRASAGRRSSRRRPARRLGGAGGIDHRPVTDEGRAHVAPLSGLGSPGFHNVCVSPVCQGLVGLEPSCNLYPTARQLLGFRVVHGQHCARSRTRADTRRSECSAGRRRWTSAR